VYLWSGAAEGEGDALGLASSVWPVGVDDALGAALGEGLGETLGASLGESLGDGDADASGVGLGESWCPCSAIAMPAPARFSCVNKTIATAMFGILRFNFICNCLSPFNLVFLARHPGPE